MPDQLILYYWGQGSNPKELVPFIVDWRSALADALADYNVPTGDILTEFERLCLDPVYGERDS
jgi:hypothetical protein